MKKQINKNLKNSISETAELGYNSTGKYQDDSIDFVQFDDNYSIASDGSIYQIVSTSELPTDSLNESCINPILFYHGENISYNYAEDSISDFNDSSQKIINSILNNF